MEQTEGSARERILARIRTAMRTTAPRHPGETVRPIFAPVTESLERFQKECAGNNTECIVTPDLSATAVAVADVLASPGPDDQVIFRGARDVDRPQVEPRRDDLRQDIRQPRLKALQQREIIEA